MFLGCTVNNLPFRLRISDEHCTKLLHSLTLLSQNLNLKRKQIFYYSRCDEPVTVTINVKVKEDDIDWSHVFTSGNELAVPGLGIDVKGVVKAGLFVKVALEPEDDKLTLKV